MAVDIVMPQMGESIFEGTITKWLKKPGDKVERDEPLFEISTDKVDAEIPSPSAGVLKEIKVAEGKTVPIQTVVGVIDAAGDASATKPAQPAASPKSEAPPAKAAQAPPSRTAAPPQPPANGKGAPAAQPQARPQPTAASAYAGSTGAPATGGAPTTGARDGGARIHSSPLVRRMAKEHGIDLSGVTGTGAGGRISKQDIEALIAGGAQQRGAAEYPADQSGEVEEELEEAFNATSSVAQTRQAPSMPPPPPRQAPAQVSSQGGAQAAGQHGGQVHASFESAVPREKIYFGDYEVQPMSVMRQRIGEHMVASKRVSAHVYSVDEIDMTKVATLRAKSKDEFEKRNGTKLTFMPFFVKAAVAGLRAYPTLNSSLDGTNIVMHKEINIGIAVALDWGLLVPVVKHADEKNILGIQRTMNDLAERARSKKLKPEEVQESTFSITNPGVFGGLFGLPVISQPNVGILGLGAIEKRPVVINDSIAIRSMCYVTLSYDHRVVDGAIAHQFLHKVKESLENWSEPLL
ncbi:MAG TPA: dihydrolipoamide acetyltransferase family protein [Candidatus Acidoferrum sp.]|jgi:2-oxoglutarate dehydrogenase E2 component (dihydrolipoamide succinyltransferase)|nr:dihydrolipoamide acetyltransferase family protein [Candidatus Acidoferrum sp.]